ncbi:MAG: helix-turn-helix transcriptional regulator [Pseudomonadota bacterium]|nr:helix-turn-helix transcriptional regulator [Pseudomonadota bacterium]
MPRRFLLRADHVRDLVDARHLTHAQVAERIGLARSYWSQLINRKRGLSPSIRRRILACDLFFGVPETELWERVALAAPEAA